MKFALFTKVNPKQTSRLYSIYFEDILRTYDDVRDVNEQFSETNPNNRAFVIYVQNGLIESKLISYVYSKEEIKELGQKLIEFAEEMN